MEPIILASSSPRRQDILKELGIPFQVIMPQVDETIPENMAVENVPEFLASQKVEAVMKTLPQGQIIPWILGADTLVIDQDNKAYGKPENQEEATKILKKLSGKTHKVVSSIALFNGKLNYLATRTNITLVTFKNMSNEEITWLVNTGEWHGATGAYRIQGKASMFIEKIEGSYSGVVGLPIFEIYDILNEQGYKILV
ncbi:MAG: septum formation protein Maf [Treponema sp.]|nr:septum formation protein Maf [Treponema sp.]